MRHDFSECLSDIENKKYVYRKYNGEECRGLMDYVDDGIGWSQCSMMDFSRYITSGGTQKPCLEGTVFNDINCKSFPFQFYINQLHKDYRIRTYTI